MLILCINFSYQLHIKMNKKQYRVQKEVAFKKLNLTIQFITLTSAIVFTLLLSGCSHDYIPDNYKGKPYHDSLYTGGPQVIPGKLQCEYYDMGGEGIAYHDADTINSGSGNLNPIDGSYLHDFRAQEAVDISFTKDQGVDNNPFDRVKPKMKQLYVGWTQPGEWLNYTIRVNKSGVYKVGLMYTANGNGKIQLVVNNKEMTDTLMVPSTHDDNDTVAWRQWHHWNYIGNLTKIQLRKGLNLLTLKTVGNGNMNYDYLLFEP